MSIGKRMLVFSVSDPEANDLMTMTTEWGCLVTKCETSEELRGKIESLNGNMLVFDTGSEKLFLNPNLFCKPLQFIPVVAHAALQVLAVLFQRSDFQFRFLRAEERHLLLFFDQPLKFGPVGADLVVKCGLCEAANDLALADDIPFLYIDVGHLTLNRCDHVYDATGFNQNTATVDGGWYVAINPPQQNGGCHQAETKKGCPAHGRSNADQLIQTFGGSKAI